MYRLTLMMLVTAATGCSSNKYATGNPVELKPHKIEYQEMVRMAMDDYTVNKLRAILTLHAAVPKLEKGQNIDLLSQAFLSTPYIANRLIGSSSSPERLVIDLGALDCFTYMDYVEALRKASNESEFVENVIQTRYINGEIDFQHRKHFFTDWAQTEHVIADDITAQLTPHAVTVAKHLNRKADGDVYLSGISMVERRVTYIPSEFIDEKTLGKLQTGDYIGIYTQLPGLDVTHTGFFIMTANGPMFRHASSRKESMKVIDSDFVGYVRNTPGIVVLRPR